MQNKELTLRQKLDAFAAEGKEIKVTWEGGSDSGSYSLFIGDQKFEWGDPLYNEVVDFVSDTVDYGSWAGDYFADGHAVYNPDEGAFIGEGKDTTSEPSSLGDVSIEIRIPKALNFDTFDISTDGELNLGELNCTVGFVISNGPVFPQHSEVENAIEDHVRESLCHILETDEACRDEEVGWVGNEWIIRRESFKEDGDDLVYVIDSIDYSYNDTRYQSYHIEINDEQ